MANEERWSNIKDTYVRKNDIGYASAREGEPTPEIEVVNIDPQLNDNPGIEYTDIPEQEPVYSYKSDGWVDSRDELEESLYQFKNNLTPEVRLSQSESLPEGNQEEAETDKGKNGKLFGFIKGKFDEVSDNLRIKTAAKQAAYQDYLQQRPRVVQQIYKNKYDDKLRKMTMTQAEKQAALTDKFSKFSTGISKVGEMLGGAKSPDAVMGFKGTVLGPFPTSRRPQYDMGMGMQQQRLQPNQRMQRPYQQEIPQQYADPGGIGSQIPKYQSRPANADPGSTWSRVVKIDKFGKKRSYLRKSRMPEQPMEQFQQPMEQFQQQQPQPQNQLFGSTGFSIEKLNSMIAFKPTNTQLPGLNNNDNSKNIVQDFGMKTDFYTGGIRKKSADELSKFGGIRKKSADELSKFLR